MVDDEHLRDVIQVYMNSHGFETDATVTNSKGETMPLESFFMAGFNSANSGFEYEWGIAYKDSEDRPVDPIRNPQAAKGIFGHYGLPGDKLVRRRIWGWETLEEK